MGLTARQIEKKIQKEQKTLQTMIGIFCRGQKHAKKQGAPLCPACAELLQYAQKRTALCPQIAEKTFCKFCNTPCYAPSKREQIRFVMRYAGPRMIFTHPIMGLQHLFLMQKEKQNK